MKVAKICVVTCIPRTRFIVNRLLFSLINEACYMLEGNVASKEEIDTAIRLGANLPMGPLELADFIGLDIINNIINRLSWEFVHFRPPTKQLETMVQQGRLGKKTGQGFYNYTR